MSLHADELPITDAVVRDLVAAQFPEWSGLALRRVVPGGTTNALYRLGEELVVRLPLRGVAEAEPTDDLARALSFPVPTCVARGAPGAGYPSPWTVWTWLPGEAAEGQDLGAAFASDLAQLIRELRAIDVRGRVFSGEGRGGCLRDHDAWMETCFERSEGLLDVGSLRARWTRYRELPEHGGEVMAHGDLVPGNVLVEGGRLAGVLDLASYGPADPSLDLVAAWHLLEEAPRARLREELGCSELEWARGEAWAFQQALGLVWYYRESHPGMSALGRRTLARLCS